MKRIIYLLSLLGAFGGHRQSVEALRTEEGASVGWGHVKQIPLKYPKTSGISLVALILCAWCVVSYLNASPPSLSKSNKEIEGLLRTALVALEDAVYNSRNTQENKKEVIRILTTYKNNFEQEESPANINVQFQDQTHEYAIVNILLFSIIHKQKDIFDQLLAMNAPLNFYEEGPSSVFKNIKHFYDDEKEIKEIKQLRKQLIEKFKQTYPDKSKPDGITDKEWAQS